MEDVPLRRPGYLSPRAARWLFGGAALVSLVVLFAPGPAVPPSPHDTDKLVHATLFAGLGLTGCWATTRLVMTTTGLAAYAVLSEVIQAVAPIARDGGVADALTDLLGLAVGVSAAYLIGGSGDRRPRHPREGA